MKKIKSLSLLLSVLLLFNACANVSKPNDSQSIEHTQDIMGVTDGVSKEEKPSVQNSLIEKGEKSAAANTFTSLLSLPTVTYTATENVNNLSTKKVCHSHGPASGGKAHYTVVEFQKNFDKYNAFTVDMSGEKVLYLTFDCGYEFNSLTSKILDVLKEKQVPAAFFCTLHHIKDQPELITRMINEGHIVGNHSTNHPSFAQISRKKMASEIEQCDNYLRENFGYSARFFRFPAGEYTDSALDLVNSIGFVSVFWSVAYSDWDVNSPKGKDYAVKTVMERLHPGAVILLHSVSQDNAEALSEIIDRARAEGYTFKALDEYKGYNS